MNPLTLQLGMTTPDSAYRLLTDFMRSLGLEPDKYLQPPTPASGAPRHTSAEALGLIMKGIYPPGEPLEPLPDHAAGITSMAPTVAASLTESEQQLLNQYMAALEQKIVAAQQQALLMQGGQSLIPGGQGGGPPEPGQNADGQPTLVNANETLDESLPMGTGTPQ